MQQSEDKAVEKKTENSTTGIKRRDFVKALAGIPVLGIFVQQFFSKQLFEEEKKENLLAELDLNETVAEKSVKPASTAKRDLIRIGVIGYGTRGEALSRSLGFAHPEWIENQKRIAGNNRTSKRLQDWMSQENLHVAITGMCDVFDMRKERGMEAAQNREGPVNSDGSLPMAKSYTDYREMLADKDIDAIIITAPDFWHAQITIDAMNAGKHVYCEKCMTRTEDEVYQVEKAVNNNDGVFQLGHQYHQSAAFGKARQVIDKNILGKVTLIEATTNRNTPDGAWVRHLDSKGNPKPGDESGINWALWLGDSPLVPFSIDRYYNWTKWWDYATGLSGQLLCHDYDTANQLLNLGIPSSCVASGGIYFHKDNREIPDIFHAVFEFEDSELTFMYSASLASSRKRGLVFMGHDGSMELGSKLNLNIDKDSTRFRNQIASSKIKPGSDSYTFQPGMGGIDAITSATELFYADRGLMNTYRDGRQVDTNYLHLKEWLDCIRYGGEPSVPIKKGVEVTLACHMATKSYRENRRVTWDPVKRRII